ncbi:MAG: AEC family transporter [Lachnospirales bacterium]
MFYTMTNTMIMLGIVMGLGFYLQKKDVLNDEVRNKLTYILLNISLPLTFFKAFQVEKNDETLSLGVTILALSIFLHILFMVLGLVLAKVIKADDSEKGIIIFGCTFKNLTYIGFPVVLGVFASYQPTFYGTLFCIPFNVLTFSLGPVFLSGKKGEKIKLKDFLTNINLAVFLGILFFLLEIKLPYAIENSISVISNMTIPLSLLLTGALLTKSDFKTLLKEPKVLIVTFVSLIIYPLIYFALAYLFYGDTFVVDFTFIMALLPSATMTMILTDKYGGNIDFAGKIVLTTTVCSLFTVAILGGLFI